MTDSAKAPQSQARLNLTLALCAIGAAGWYVWERLSPDQQEALASLARATWEARSDPAALVQLHGYTLVSGAAVLIGLRLAWMFWGRPLLRGTASHARTTARGVVVSGARGATASPVGGEPAHRGADPTRRGVAVGAGGRKDGEGDDWAADEVAVLEHSGGFAFREPPPRGWLVPDLVPHGPVPVWRWHWRRPTRQRPLIDREVKGYTTVVLGSGGVGKSYLDVDLGIAALTGGTWLGKPVQRLKNVLYVDCELDSQTFWTRAYAVARGRWLERGKPPKGLHYLRLHASLASWAGQQQIREAVRKSKADLILVDSLTIGAYGLALADQNGWRRVYAGFERWGKPVVAIDHLGKEAGKGAVGTFMKQAMVRSALTMERERGGNIKVEHSKTNFGPQVETFRVVSSFMGGTSKDDPLTVSFIAVAPAAGIEPATDRLTGEHATTAPRGKETRAYTAPPGVARTTEVGAGTGPAHLGATGAPPTASGSDPEPSARTHSVTPLPLPILTPPASPVQALLPNALAQVAEDRGAHADEGHRDQQDPNGLTEPLRGVEHELHEAHEHDEPARSQEDAHGDLLVHQFVSRHHVSLSPSPVLAWLRGQPDPLALIPSRDIYAALGAQGVTLRACKVQLKALWEAGQLERSGTANGGYRYKLPDTVAPVQPEIIGLSESDKTPARPAKRSKYHAVRTEYSGQTYDSRGEAAYAQHLDTLRDAGTIHDWRRGRPWVLQDADPANDSKGIVYIPDMEILDAAGNVLEVHDFKGMELPAWRLKAKLFRQRHPSVPLVIVTKRDLPA